MADLQTLIENDIRGGLGDVFQVLPGTFITELDVPPLTGDDFSALPWSVQALHTEPFIGISPRRDADGEPVSTVTIEGLTIVQGADGDESEARFVRYIDWSAVLAQLNVGTTGRPVEPDPEMA